MIQGAIIIELTSGARIKYVRDTLAAKSGNDGATPSNLLFAGVPKVFYAYTGAGTDTYATQTGAGKIAGDLTTLETNLAIAITDGPTSYLTFPEATPSIELVRYNKDQTSGRKTFIRTKIKKVQVSRIYVEESWVESHLFPDSLNLLPSWSPNFKKDSYKENPFVMPTSETKTLYAPKLTTTSATGTSTTLNWTLDPAYANYKVYLNGYLTASGISIGTYTFSSLTKATSYVMGVSGVTSTGKEGAISTTNIYTLTDAVIVTPTPTAYTVGLSWTSVYGAAFYRIYNGANLIESKLTATTKTIANLLPDTAYTLYVKVANVWEQDVASTTVNTSTLMIPPVVTYTTPNAATTTTATIVTNWGKYKSDYVYSTSLNGGANLITNQNVVTYTYTGLNADTAYTIDVWARNIATTQGPHFSTSVTTGMAAPVLAVGTKTATTIPVTWTNLKTGYVYKMYRDGVLVFTTAANATSYTFTGLTTATSYNLTAIAVNASLKEGPVSNTLTIVTS